MSDAANHVRQAWSIDEFTDYEIVGFGVAGYRSFWGVEPQVVGPFGKLHLVAGANNSGKSNILRFASSIMSTLEPTNLTMNFPSGADVPIGTGVSTALKLDMLITLPNSFGESELLSRVGKNELGDWKTALDILLDLFTHSRVGPRRVVKLEFEEADSRRKQLRPSGSMLQRVVEKYEVASPGHPIPTLISYLMSHSPGGSHENFLDGLVRQIMHSVQVPAIADVSAFRQISESSGEQDNYSGRGLIRRLAELENPPSHDVYEDNTLRFEAINAFVQEVVGDPSARIRVASGQDDILVVSNGRVLPLASLGTGIHEVVILAVAGTLLSDHLVCMEEPEIHMHPVMQRRLLAYLTSTGNRYLVATHSAALLDQSIASISHISMSAAGSRVSASATADEIAHLVSELGYRASDLVQANLIIWVEGPSDRNYLRFWLSVVDPELTEGVHFSIMFYGGSLLSHLSAEDRAVHDFISLRRLNRNSVILIDSDRTSSSDDINATKKRIRKEFNLPDGSGFAWITHGYTIENYVPRHLLESAVSKVHPKSKYVYRAGRFTNPLAGTRFTNSKFKPDKTAISSSVVENWLPTEPLPDHVLIEARKLSKAVRLANGLEPKNFVGRPRKE